LFWQFSDKIRVMQETINTIWVIIKSFWPLWLLLGAVIIIRFLFLVLFPALIKKAKNKKKFKAGQKWHSDRDLIYWLRGMKPWEFEEYIAELFRKFGFKTEKVGGGYDKGIDVIAEKDGIKHYIQCKKYITSVVGVGEVRDFYGAIADHLANGKGYFITTNKFTLEAEKFVEDKPIELIDQFDLIKYIKLAEKKKK